MTTATRVGAREAWELLRKSRALIEPELRAVVHRLDEPIRDVAGYHFGWCDSAGRPAEADWGKGLRGALVLASAQAVGATPEQAVPMAAAVELVHNFSLIHDDLMDGDRTRRGRPTVWSVFGDSQAVLAGDALQMLAFDVIAREYPGQCATAGRELGQALIELVNGQAVDLSFERRTDVRLDECLKMAADKTAALLAGACALGGLVADADADRVSGLRRFGRHLGVAFQLVDDLLGIWGDSSVTGKPVGSDLRSRKKSLPVVAALCSGTPAGDRLAELYHRADPGQDAGIAPMARLIEEAGGRRWAAAQAAHQRAEAAGCLAGILPDPEGARALLLISDVITRREF